MSCSRVCTGLAAALLAALPGAALAQFQPPPAAGSAPVQDRWPEAPKPQQPGDPAFPPAAKPAKRAPAQQTLASPDGEEAVKPPPPKPAKPAAPASVVACGGPFAKDTTHLKLATRYDSRNLIYGQVDGPEGTKIPGTILFPNDPKRRLEVLWNNEAARSNPAVIAINGKSQWSAPKGIRLGLSVAALEKANGKPFKISSFGKDGTAEVAGWEGGALATLPGGCKMGMRLHVDAKASEDARQAVIGDKELASNDAGVKAVKPTVLEILIGY